MAQSPEATTTWLELFALYVCPSIGCILSFLMFSSPVGDLTKALQKGSLGHLATLPWAVGLANSWGWTLYGYLSQNAFLMLSNIPALLISIHLNHGAIKLQYYALWKDHRASKQILGKESQIETGTKQTEYESINSSSETQSLLSIRSNDADLLKPGLVDQERIIYPLLTMWMIVSVYVGWFAPQTDATVTAVGAICNVNLVFFYGSPLQTLHQVIVEQHASLIHRPSLFMTTSNSGFWLVYGLAIADPVIWATNCVGVGLGVAQFIALCVFPSTHGPGATEGQALLEGMVVKSAVDEPLPIRTREDLIAELHPAEILVPNEIQGTPIV